MSFQPIHSQKKKGLSTWIPLWSTIRRRKPHPPHVQSEEQDVPRNTGMRHAALSFSRRMVGFVQISS